MYPFPAFNLTDPRGANYPLVAGADLNRRFTSTDLANKGKDAALAACNQLQYESIIVNPAAYFPYHDSQYYHHAWYLSTVNHVFPSPVPDGSGFLVFPYTVDGQPRDIAWHLVGVCTASAVYPSTEYCEYDFLTCAELVEEVFTCPEGYSPAVKDGVSVCKLDAVNLVYKSCWNPPLHDHDGYAQGYTY